MMGLREAASARLCATCGGPGVQVDALTGLANRRQFVERLNDALADWASDDGQGLRCGGSEFGVLLIDLDRFKAVNDSLGHAAGDELLGAVGRRLAAGLRQQDVAARLGGDEFAVVLARPLDRATIRGVAVRLIELLERPFMVGHDIVSVGASIGVVCLIAGETLDAETLLSQADLALYQAKGEGRGRLCFFKRELRERAEARRLLEQDLRAALPLGQFELFYQPQVDLTSNRLNGFEALIRWRHPVRGLVSPDTFIPVAEELNIISSVGDWVIEEACREASRWPSELVVSVNIAAAQFDTGELVRRVVAALQSSGLSGSRLDLEITESVLLSNTASVTQQLIDLKALGAKISLDDFGTGYSSLTQLRSFPFDRIKIDRSFADDTAVVQAVAALGASLGMRTVAEGVETRQQLARMRNDGCSEAQGFLFSRPVPAAQVPAVIASLAALSLAPQDFGDEPRPVSFARDTTTGGFVKLLQETTDA